MNKICTQELKLCKNDEEFINWNNEGSMDFDFVNFVEEPNCVICQRSVDKLNEKRGDSSRKLSVEEICGDDSECSDFMFNFQDFFQKDNVNRDSMLACTELDVCLFPGKVQLLGGDNKCLYGPSYWCLSSAHADACKVSLFLRRIFLL